MPRAKVRKYAKQLGNMAQAVAYVRLSPRDGETALGLEVQRSAIESWAARESVVIVGWYTDTDVSGDQAFEERPALQDALQALEAGVGILVVHKRDRLARGSQEAALIIHEARQRGAVVRWTDALASTGDEAVDELLGGLLDYAAKVELGRIRQRTKAALQAKRARGEWTGNAPYGFRVAADGVHLEPDESEQRVIALARSLREGGDRLGVVVDTINAHGHRSRKGTPFSHAQVHWMLKNDAARQLANRDGGASNFTNRSASSTADSTASVKS